RGRLERDVAAAGAERGLRALAVADVAARLGATARDADAGRVSGREVADEDIHQPVRVAADEVRRQRLERDEAAVGANRGKAAGAVRLASAAADADAGRHAARLVVQEDVGNAVRV